MKMKYIMDNGEHKMTNLPEVCQERLRKLVSKPPSP